jgi:hypothetical protein
MHAVLPVDRARINETHKRLMHQRRGVALQVSSLSSHILPPETAEVIVDEWRQAFECLCIAAPPRSQESRDVGGWRRHHGGDHCRFGERFPLYTVGRTTASRR